MKQKLKIKCADAYELGATLFTPETAPKLVIQLNTATATKQHFYFNFCEFLCDSLNAAVLTFDYRGIGDSRPLGGLKNFDVAYEDWARLDTTAVTRFLKNKYPQLPLVYFGHSVGGQMVGLLPCLDLVNGMVTVGSTTGYTKFMKPNYRPKAWFFFEIVTPLSIAFYGYGKFKFLGIMEDLPKKLINTWRDWCQVEDYFFDPRFASKVEGIEGYQNLNMPITILVASDDEIATKPNVQNFWKHTKNTQDTTIKFLTPSEFNLKEIGHFGFFKSKMKNTLWPLAVDEIKNILKHDQIRNSQ